MNLLTRWTSPEAERGADLQLQDWLMQFGGFNYLLADKSTMSGPPGVPAESPPSDFVAMVQQVYQRNGVVAACMAARLFLFTEARFKFRNLSDRKMFGDTALLPLERPWPNGSSGELLARMEQDASLAGNAYILAKGPQRLRLRPDWVHIILGTNEVDGDGHAYEAADAPDATVVGYAYWPGGKGGKYAPRVYLPSEVGHFSPIPDPVARFRGQSWLTPVLKEIDTDRQLTEHKAGFLERGATPSFAVKYPETFGMGDGGETKREAVITSFREQHEGVANSWKALHLFGGADPIPLGTNFRDLDYKAVQGAGETRICAAARVPASVVGISEGLAGSALNAGNFGQSRRQFGEQYAYPNWRMACEALAPLISVPSGAELWYDTSDVAFLREDAKDAAEVRFTEAQAIKQLIEAGFEFDAAVAAITGGDLTLLTGKHTGLVSVQLQPPGQTQSDEPSAPAPSLNGAN